MLASVRNRSGTLTLYRAFGRSGSGAVESACHVTRSGKTRAASKDRAAVRHAVAVSEKGSGTINIGSGIRSFVHDMFSFGDVKGTIVGSGENLGYVGIRTEVRMNPTLARRLTAEALGTCLLVATVVGSGIMAERLTQDVALALLGNTLPTGAILVVLITILGPISGAHFNPAVTIVFCMRRDIPVAIAGGYVVAQILGGVLGTVIAHGMFDASLIQVAEKARTGPSQWFSAGNRDRRIGKAGRGRKPIGSRYIQTDDPRHCVGAKPNGPKDGKHKPERRDPFGKPLRWAGSGFFCDLNERDIKHAMRNHGAKHTTKDLRHDISPRNRDRDIAAHAEHHRDSRIEMRARNRPQDRDQHDQNGPSGQGIAQQCQRNILRQPLGHDA